MSDLIALLGRKVQFAWPQLHLMTIRVISGRGKIYQITTFTNKAALELKDRIQRNLERTGFPLPVEQIHAGTIHSLCADILRSY